MMDFTKKLNLYVAYFLVFLIKIYQKTISFDHGVFKVFFPYGYCRYHPTCSEYAVQSLSKHGFIKGAYRSLWRLLRCHPWSKGGIDPV